MRRLVASETNPDSHEQNSHADHLTDEGSLGLFPELGDRDQATDRQKD
jgi:hypothetical protein